MNKILIPVEDIGSAEALIDFICSSSWLRESQLKVIHVVEVQEAVAEWPGEQFRLRAQELVASVATKLKERLPESDVTEAVLDGVAKETIIDTAESWGANAIVMGSHGRRGMTRFLLGSVSSAVSNYAPCSVIIVRNSIGKISSAASSEMENKQPVGSG